MKGTLAIVGAGEYLETMEGVDRALLARAGGNRVVLLPTASAPDGPGVPERWNRMGVEHFTRLGAIVDALLALDRSDCSNAANAERVRQANLVYFSGGKPDYLRQTLEGTAVWESVLNVLEGGGVVAGCSAGAMIMGAYVPDFSMRRFPPAINSWHPAFGLVPGAIVVPHYNEFPEMMVNLFFGRRPPGTFLIGVDAGAALVGNGGDWEVMGARRVTIRNGKSTRRLTAGDRVYLPTTDTENR